MAIQHAVIPDIYLHEPKGIITAAAGLVYVANGGGSGSWIKLSSASLQGLTGDGSIANRKVLTDGANGFKIVTDSAYGSMVVTNNTNNFAVGLAADATLNTNSDYTLFTGTGAPLAAGAENSGVTFSTDRLTVANAGRYRISITATVASPPSATAKVALKFRTNGTGFSPRRAAMKGTTAGAITQVHLDDVVTLAAADYVQLVVASSAAGSLVLEDVTVLLTLISAT